MGLPTDFVIRRSRRAPDVTPIATSSGAPRDDSIRPRATAYDRPGRAISCPSDRSVHQPANDRRRPVRCGTNGLALSLSDDLTYVSPLDMRIGDDDDGSEFNSRPVKRSKAKHLIAEIRYGAGNGPSHSSCTCGASFEAESPDALKDAWYRHAPRGKHERVTDA